MALSDKKLHKMLMNCESQHAHHCQGEASSECARPGMSELAGRHELFVAEHDRP